MLLTLLPEIVLGVGGLVLLTLDFLRPKAQKLMLNLAAILGVLAALAIALTPPSLGGFFRTSELTFGFSIIVVFGSLITLAMVVSDDEVKNHLGSYLALIFFAAAGCLLLIKAQDFLYAFLAVELISLSSFILTGFERKELHLLEGALKYFLVGAFSSAIALYGISLYYMALGTTAFNFPLERMTASQGILYFASLLLIFVSFGFKASIVPFHFWAPDAYQSAPTPIAAFLSVVPKLATLAALINIFNKAIPAHTAQIHLVLAALACLTMTIGNVSAIHQNNLKRLLAYSSIAQAGYMMIGLLGVSHLGMASILIYGFSYLFMNFGAFACAQWIANHYGSYEIDSCDGLSLRHFPQALAFTLFLLSLAGIPPLVGFIGKYFVFASALQAKWAWWVAVVGVLNSVISVYYYMRIVYRMYFVDTQPVGLNVVPLNQVVLSGLITLLFIGTLLLGLYPRPILAMVNL